MRDLPAGNFKLPAFSGLLLKDSYWRWPERNLAGITIDFFVQASVIVSVGEVISAIGTAPGLWPSFYMRGGRGSLLLDLCQRHKTIHFWPQLWSKGLELKLQRIAAAGKKLGNELAKVRGFRASVQQAFAHKIHQPLELVVAQPYWSGQ